jgi:hypothetical protein
MCCAPLSGFDTLSDFAGTTAWFSFLMPRLLYKEPAGWVGRDLRDARPCEVSPSRLGLQERNAAVSPTRVPTKIPHRTEPPT